MSFRLAQVTAAITLLAAGSVAQAAVVVQTANLNLSRTDTNVTNACGNPAGGGNGCIGYAFISGLPTFNPFDAALGTLVSARLNVVVNGSVDATGWGDATFSYGSLTQSASFSPSLGNLKTLALAGELDLLALPAVTGPSDFAPYTFRGLLGHTGFFPAAVTMAATGTFTLTYEYRLRPNEPGTPVPVPGTLALLGAAALAGVATRGRRRMGT